MRRKSNIEINIQILSYIIIYYHIISYIMTNIHIYIYIIFIRESENVLRESSHEEKRVVPPQAPCWLGLQPCLARAATHLEMNMSRFFQMKKMVNMSGGSTSKVCGSNSMMHLVNTKGSSSSYSKQWLFFAEVRQGHIHLDPSGLRSTVPFSDKLQCQRTNIELIFFAIQPSFSAWQKQSPRNPWKSPRNPWKSLRNP